jgi:hypothetical protein
MALQSSGAISLSDIKTELGSSANDFRTLHAAAGFSTPDSISEFYGYSNVTYKEVAVVERGFGDPSEACAEGLNFESIVLYYVEDGERGFQAGITLYTSPGGEEFDGGGAWFYFPDRAESIYIDNVIGEEFIPCG